MRLKESVKAREVLRQLRELRSDQPTVGAALVALGELAYNEGNYVTAIGLFDNVKSRWPELLNANSTAVFQAAELCRLFDRADEAKAKYGGSSSCRLSRSLIGWQGFVFSSYSRPKSRIAPRKSFASSPSHLRKQKPKTLRLFDLLV